MGNDTALQFFLEDQRASGLSVREYEKKHGIFLSPPGSDRPMGRYGDILGREVPLSPKAELLSTEPHCVSCGRRITDRRSKESEPRRPIDFRGPR